MSNHAQHPTIGSAPAATLKVIRHEVSTAIGQIETAYEELKEDPSSEFAHRYFEMAISRLKDLVGQLDQEASKCR